MSSSSSSSSPKPQVNPETQKHKERCNMLLAISPRIRYVGVMNRFGRTLAGGLRKGVVPLLRPEEARNEYFIEATRNQLRKNFEKSIGKTEYTLTENEKVKILTLTNDDHFYYITMDKDTPAAEVAQVIESAKKLAR